MCAGGEGKDVCQGFGGAPLFIQENGIFSQVSHGIIVQMSEYNLLINIHDISLFLIMYFSEY